MRAVRHLTMVTCGIAAMLGASAPAVAADPAPFDLAGPSLAVSVTRAGVTLPIGAVPQLAAGDTITVEATLPATETAHYLLVAAFLRDPTNPPPPDWFFKSETWKKPKHGAGALTLTVPSEAKHLALFLAPSTNGDFGTLRKAVESRPGAFIRAAQDLELASLDRSRFETYLAAIRRIATANPDALGHDAPIIAGALRIKINDECLQRQTEFQAACLLDTKQTVVLGADGASNSSALSGAATDLVLSLSATPAGGAGYYSPYVGAVRDIVGIFGAMRSAHYQYIPALGLADRDKLTLVLNAPPSFADPKSVMMAALPEIKPAAPLIPRRQPGGIEPCVGAKEPLVPLTVSPLFYATGYARDLVLRVTLPGSTTLDLPLAADAVRGGLTLVQAPAVLPADAAGSLTGTVHGMWGFDAFTGPEVTLAAPGDWHWQRKDPGRDDAALALTGAASACVASITVAHAHGKPLPASWHSAGPDEIAVSLPAKEERHEQITVAVIGPEGTTPATFMVAPPARAPVPAAQIAAHSSEPPPLDAGAAPIIHLDSPDEIPASARLSFTLKAAPNQQFTGREAVEVGTSGNDTTTRLTVGNGLTLVDATVLVASVVPAQALGGSAYGPLRARLVLGEATGDWLGLGTLVRLPRLKALTCPEAAKACTLHGDALYLLASVATNRDFDDAASVPEGFPGSTFPGVHRTHDGTLYVRLHDAPEVVNAVKFGTVAASAK